MSFLDSVREQSPNKADTFRTKIDKINERIQTSSDRQATSKSSDPKDWTRSYEFWSRYDDVEDLQDKKSVAETQLGTLLDQAPGLMDHYHDHSDERKIFELPEPEKLTICAHHREMGNFLFDEGLFPKAAEQYQIALSYYEYCFPENPKDTAALDDMRHACLCNISMCYYRLGHLRKAIESASHVLAEDSRSVKALCRRAQAYLALDEYG
jgi:hypothetical protein